MSLPSVPLSSVSPRGQIVVFGAGYVGEAVCRHARERGLEVTALTRNPVKAAALSAFGVKTVIADLASEAWHSQVPEAPDYVVNCVSSGGGGISGYRLSYLEGARSLIVWAKAKSARGTLVYTGSTSVYPQGAGTRVDEASSTTPPASENAGILLETETLLQTWPGRTFVLRLSGIYGPGRHHLLDQMRAGSAELPGRGEHRLNLIYRDDIVDAIWRALTAPAAVGGQTLNLSDDGSAPRQDVVGFLAKRLGVAVPRFTGEASGGRRAVVPDRFIANARVKEVLGWEPRFPTFREGYAAILGA